MAQNDDATTHLRVETSRFFIRKVANAIESEPALRRKCAFAAKNTVRFLLGFQCSDFTAAGGVLVPKKMALLTSGLLKIESKPKLKKPLFRRRRR
jgi:hypothetical protein